MDDDLKARAYVVAMYQGSRWKSRVRRMTSEQVVAIYLKELKKKEDHESDSEGLGTHNESPDALSAEEFTQPALWSRDRGDDRVDGTSLPSDFEGGGSVDGDPGDSGYSQDDGAQGLF